MSPRAIELLEKHRRSCRVPLRGRLAVGRVLARAEDVRDDDAAMVERFLAELAEGSGTVDDVEAAARVAIWFADHDATANWPPRPKVRRPRPRSGAARAAG